MKVKIRVVVAVAAASLMLTACGSSSSAGSSGGSAGSAGRVVHISFWARATAATISKALVNRFNATHKTIKVSLTVLPAQQDVTKIGTALGNGSAPDVIGLNDIFNPQFAEQGSLRDLSSLYDSLSFKSKLSPGQLNLGRYNGKLYGVPYNSDLSVLVYNKTLFKKAGLNPDVGPKNFAQLLADAKKITSLGNGVEGFDFEGACSGCFVFTGLPFMWASGGQVLNPAGTKATLTSSAGVRKALTLFRTLWNEHLVGSWDRTDDGTTWGVHFEAGKVGMEPFDAAFAQTAAHDKVNVGIAAIPGASGGSSTFAGGDNFVVPTSAKHPTQAEAFIKWALQAPQQVELAKLGFTPVRSDLITSSFKASYPYIAASLKEEPRGQAPFSTRWSQLTATTSPWINLWQEAIFGKGVAPAISTAQAAFTSVLGQ